MAGPVKIIRRGETVKNLLTPTQPEVTKEFKTHRGPRRVAWKLGIYGEPGVGKSTLGSLCPGAKFADIENSMQDLNVEVVLGITKWEELRAWVKQRLGLGYSGIDSMSKAEDWCAEYVIKTKMKDGEYAQTSIEDFKYAAGSKFVADEFRLLLSDIDRSFESGMSWIMMAHNKVDWFKNPDDKDFMFNSPDLIDTKKASVRADWIRFCDHIAFIAKDVAVTKGKAIGGSGRTIYMDGNASRVSKQRGLDIDALTWPVGDITLWKKLGAVKQNEEKSE